MSKQTRRKTCPENDRRTLCWKTPHVKTRRQWPRLKGGRGRSKNTLDQQNRVKTDSRFDHSNVFLNIIILHAPSMGLPAQRISQPFPSLNGLNDGALWDMLTPAIHGHGHCSKKDPWMLDIKAPSAGHPPSPPANKLELGHSTSSHHGYRHLLRPVCWQTQLTTLTRLYTH